MEKWNSQGTDDSGYVELEKKTLEIPVTIEEKGPRYLQSTVATKQKANLESNGKDGTTCTNT
jgi:hypothetical protein